MDKSEKIMWGIVLVVAVIWGMMYLNIIPSLFTIGAGSTAISGSCSSVSIDATYTAVAGECYVYTLNNQDTVLKVTSMQTVTNSAGDSTCRIEVGSPSSKADCLNGKVYIAAGVKTDYCSSNADCSGTICANHVCTSRPVNTCNTVGAKQCVDSGSYQECQSNNLWSGGLPCSQGFSCSSGNCVAQCTEADWTSIDGACQSSNTLTRSWNKLTSCSGGVSHSTESIACTYVPNSVACTSYTYSDWSSCNSNNQQTRTVTSATPTGCIQTPVLTQTCTYVPACTDSNWQAVYGSCVNNQQTVSYNKVGSCSGTKASTTQSCVSNMTCTSFTYGQWSSCQTSNVRTRTAIGSPLTCTGGSPMTSESCVYSATNSTSTANQTPAALTFLDKYLWVIVGVVMLLIVAIMFRK